MNEIINDKLTDLIKRGGIYYRVPGSTKQEIMKSLINLLDDMIPQKKEILLQAVIEREALVSTGIDNGIAIPHPRTPMLDESEEPFVTIAFPMQPIDWGTPDNKKVHTIFLIISKTPKQHLGALSKINYICRDEKFLAHLRTQAEKNTIIAAVKEIESAWS